MFQPVKIDVEADRVFAGGYQSFFMNGGKVFACGNNTLGQLGIQEEAKYYDQIVQLPLS